MQFESVHDLFHRAFPDPNDPGACLMIARRGELLHLECAGLANLETRESITGKTNFRLASLTKQFTAAAVLLLRQSDEVKLEATLQTFFPDFPAYGARTISLRHLLQHTSGLLDYEDFVALDATEPLLDEDVLELTCKHDHTYFESGTQFRYSNTGYALLACIIQKVVGMPFSLALEKLIFQPVGMKDTAVLHKRHQPHIRNRALGYWRHQDGTIVEADQNLTSAVLGDGGAYSSVQEYLLWDRALWEGSLLPPDVVTEAITAGTLQAPSGAYATNDGYSTEACVLSGGVAESSPDAATDACALPYGLGWRLETNDFGHYVAYHPGSTTGFNHCVRRVPELGLTVLLLANRTSAGSKELARNIESDLIESKQF